MSIVGMFTDKGEWSWRKMLTAICAIVFATAQLGYLIAHNFDELPTAYWGVDVTVFTYYFLKETLQNIRLTNNKDE
jgi:hypothetical protein